MFRSENAGDEAIPELGFIHGTDIPVENGINIYIQGAFHRGGKFPCEAKTVIRRCRPLGTNRKILVFILHLNEV